MIPFYFFNYIRHYGVIISLGVTLVACGGGGSSKSGTTSPSSSDTMSSSISLSSNISSSVISSSSSIVSSAESSIVDSTPSNSSSSSSSSSSTSVISSSSLSSSSTATKQTGILVDSAVAGIHYETSPGGFSGKTSSNGEYNYATGDSVIFSIGNLKFPAVTAKNIVTPLDIAGTTDPENQIALNIAALLQSLDIDGEVNNGISIDYETSMTHAQALNFNQSYETFATMPAVSNLVANSGSSIKTLVSKSSALAHMQMSLEKINTEPLIGTWYAKDNNFNYVLFILDTSRYAVLNYEGSGATFEHGVYRWNKQTAELNVDTSEVLGTTPNKTPFMSGVLLIINSDIITVTNSSGNSIELSRLSPSNTNPLIGGWSSTVGGNLAVIAFTDTHYFHGQNGPSVRDGNGNITGVAGAEYGTYTNSSSAFTVKTLADTNLQWGFSHPCNVVESHRNQQANDLSCMSGNAAYTLNTSRNILTLYSGANAIANQINPYPYDNNPLYYYFDRVTKNDAEIYGFPSPLNGSWTGSDGHDTFIFSGYNQFTHIKSFSDDPENCKAGTATGTYTWDATTGAFNVALVSDTTVTEAAGSCSIEGLSTLKLDGNTLKLTTEGEFIFTRK